MRKSGRIFKKQISQESGHSVGVTLAIIAPV